MSNGGIIGVANIPTKTTASGVWTLQEQFLARAQDIWPTGIPEIVKNADVWLDAADTLTITESGGNVSQWVDKSSSALTFVQATGISQPTLTTVNGLNALSFDGSNDGLKRSSTTTITKNITQSTVYAVAKFNSSPSGEKDIFRFDTGTGNARLLIGGGIATGKAFFGGRRLDADSFARVDSTSNVSTTSPQLFIGGADYSNTTATVFINNVLQGTNSSWLTTGATSNTDSVAQSIGFNGGSAAYFDGVICELLLFQTLHTTSERLEVATYLANKWGITL
jgi:hypothetical protein